MVCGAVMPCRRSAATKVIVFQWPCGTWSTSRSPRAQRPYSRTICVLAEVSSMNTSRAGSNRPCSRFQRRRARATSARSCSAARKLFFEGDLVALKKPPHRCPATGYLVLAHRADHPVQCQVRLHLDQRQQKVRVFFQRRCAPTTRFGGTLAGLAKALHPDHRRAGAHFVVFRCLRREAPLSTCPITRWRISAEYAFAIDRLPKSNQCRKTRASIAKRESPRFNQAGTCSKWA